MASMQAVGCSSSFTSFGAPLIGVRGSPFSCKRATILPPRSSLVLPGGDECSLSTVDYEDVSSQWLSADFLNLRLRSSGLICDEAVQALRKHFQKKGEQPACAISEALLTATRQSVEEAAPSACKIRSPSLPRVVVYDEALFAQLYNSSSTYTTMCSFLDESFC